MRLRGVQAPTPALGLGSCPCPCSVWGPPAAVALVKAGPQSRQQARGWRGSRSISGEGVSPTPRWGRGWAVNPPLPAQPLCLAQAVPGEVSPQDGYVLLLALLSIFIGGTLVLLSSILIICRRCCEADRQHSRWAPP